MRHIAFGLVNLFEKAFELSYGVAHQHTLKVIAIAQTMCDTHSNRIDVFEGTCILCSDDVVGDFGTDIAACHLLGKRICGV